MNEITKDHFHHFRIVNKNPDCRSSVTSRGGATVCFHPEPEYDRTTVGIAICSPLDNFNKSIGRAKALGRTHCSIDVQLITIIPRVMSADDTLDTAYDLIAAAFERICRRHNRPMPEIITRKVAVLK